MFHLVFAYLPIVLLIFFMTKRNSMPSFKALPLAALVVYCVVLIVFKQDMRSVHAAIIDGLLVAWTPITIIAGAIFLFRTMEVIGALATIRVWLNSVSENPVAQLMIVGWAFQFLIEGASGFGTPAAIAAPVLVGLGFTPVRVAIFCLILNSVPVSFGAVGTPIGFGLSVVGLSVQELQSVAFKTALLNSVAALPVVLVALRFLVPLSAIKRNVLFIGLSVASCVLPYIATAILCYEFPSLVGGLIGLLLSITFAKYGIGLTKAESLEVNNIGQCERTENTDASPLQKVPSLSGLVKATFPLWGTVLLLIITRISQLGIKPLLQLSEPNISFELGALGTFSISAALVISLQGILGTEQSWSHSLLYVPSIIPFVVIALIALWRSSPGRMSVMAREVTAITFQQMKKSVIALLGALVFVRLMMMGNEQSLVALIGQHLAAITGGSWGFFAPFLGALGTFFSGSATISNLTFAGIQYSIAADLGLELSTVLALQSAGAALGNMVCINNIVAVASVLALGNQEGYILKRTALAMLVYGVIVSVVGSIL